MSLRPAQEAVQLLVSDNSLWAPNAPLDALLSLGSGPHPINMRKAPPGFELDVDANGFL